MAEKQYYVQHGIGKAKYVVNSNNGVSKHNDGSPFYDIAIFRNKKKMELYLKELTSRGYHQKKMFLASGNRQAKKDKYESCVQQVKKQENVNPYAVCTASVGRPHTTHSRRSGRSRRSM